MVKKQKKVDIIGASSLLFDIFERMKQNPSEEAIFEKKSAIGPTIPPSSTTTPPPETTTPPATTPPSSTTTPPPETTDDVSDVTKEAITIEIGRNWEARFREKFTEEDDMIPILTGLVISHIEEKILPPILSELEFNSEADEGE